MWAVKANQPMTFLSKKMATKKMQNVLIFNHPTTYDGRFDERLVENRDVSKHSSTQDSKNNKSLYFMNITVLFMDGVIDEEGCVIDEKTKIEFRNEVEVVYDYRPLAMGYLGEAFLRSDGNSIKAEIYLNPLKEFKKYSKDFFGSLFPIVGGKIVKNKGHVDYLFINQLSLCLKPSFDKRLVSLNDQCTLNNKKEKSNASENKKTN